MSIMKMISFYFTQAEVGKKWNNCEDECERNEKREKEEEA